jgi:hypothetical protein
MNACLEDHGKMTLKPHAFVQLEQHGLLMMSQDTIQTQHYLHSTDVNVMDTPLEKLGMLPYPPQDVHAHMAEPLLLQLAVTLLLATAQVQVKYGTPTNQFVSAQIPKYSVSEELRENVDAQVVSHGM